MTCAGLASLVIARHHLGEKKPTLDPAAVGGLEWLAWHFSLEENPVSPSLNHYYYLYGLERVGMLAGIEFIGEHEWYPEGARYLLENQKSDGSWASKRDHRTVRPPTTWTRATRSCSSGGQRSPWNLPSLRSSACAHRKGPACGA
jgi:hypothetical protein